MRSFFWVVAFWAVCVSSSSSMAQNTHAGDAGPLTIRLPLVQPAEKMSIPFQGPRGLSYPFQCKIGIPAELKRWLSFSCPTLRLTGKVPAGVRKSEYTIVLTLMDNDGSQARYVLQLPIGTETYIRLDGRTEPQRALGNEFPQQENVQPVDGVPEVMALKRRGGAVGTVGTARLEPAALMGMTRAGGKAVGSNNLVGGRGASGTVPAPAQAAAVAQAAAPALSAPTLLTVPNTKTRMLQGKGQAPSNAMAIRIYVCTESTAPTAEEMDCTAGAGNSSVAGLTNGQGNDNHLTPDGGNVYAILANAPDSGSFVWLVEKGVPASGATPDAVFSAVSDAVSVAIQPTISNPVKAGDNPVHGSAVPSANGKTVSVQLLHKKPTDLAFTPVLDPVTTNAAGAWTVSYEAQGGEVLQVEQTSSAVGLIDEAGKRSLEATVAAVANEREHYTFVGGTLLSQTGSNFSQQNLFLAFNLDRSLYNPGWFRGFEFLCDEGGHKVLPADTSVPPLPRYKCLPNRHPGLNGIFEARLTAIPVNVSMTQTAGTTGATGTSGTTGTTTMMPSASSFISSQKSARILVGGYIPFMFGKVPTLASHAYQETSTFYVGPIIKTGFDTLTDSTLQVASSVQSMTSATGTVSVTPTSTLSQLGSTGQLNRLYSFATGGVRFGTATIGTGSLDTDHYLDVTFGRFSNLESLFCPIKGGCMTTCPPATTGSATCTPVLDPTQESRARVPRVSIEGYFRIPTTGFVIGMSANIGQSTLLTPANADRNNRAVDDLRFLFGYKVDINKLVQHFPQVF